MQCDAPPPTPLAIFNRQQIAPNRLRQYRVFVKLHSVLFTREKERFGIRISCGRMEDGEAELTSQGHFRSGRDDVGSGRRVVCRVVSGYVRLSVGLRQVVSGQVERSCQVLYVGLGEVASR